nr:phosphoribosylformylglycinamidine cyclo-ligase [Acidobacteriota bacterium]
VGAVERQRLIDGKKITPGDALVGVPSSGLHTNGYSLARRVAFDDGGLGHDSVIAELGTTIGEALLVPHRSYLPSIRPLLPTGMIKGMAHITGGGITDNLPRIVPDGLHAVVDRASWTVPPVFRWLQARGSVPADEMYRTFNMGIGMIIACAPHHESAVLDALGSAGEPGAVRVGTIGSGGEGVSYVG